MVGSMAYGIAAILLFFMYFGVYFIAVYVFTRVGRKFGVGSFIQFMIPIWNMILLCDCGKVSRWTVAAIAAPGLILWPLNKLGIVVTPDALDTAAGLIIFLGNAYIWGNIAGRLGKNKVLWGLMTPLLAFIPAAFLAFGDAMPVDRRNDRYIDV